MEIVDLKARPQFFNVVADRIWNAWWKPSGASLSDVEAALSAVIASAAFPFTLIGVEDEKFAGTVTCIASDIAARPDLGPCVAALWVEPDRRGCNLGGRLVEMALQRLVAAGFDCAYLAARQPLRSYYRGQGWELIEDNVGDDALDVFKRTFARG
ncbi:GNAT family N-acetyltransferase [Devosia sp.]|uniref:GNAT family N-acetyltransferase n=1 Tax=Devosia sp. TaxID=1871048 RepID=UPI001B0CBA16|nr:GNAT family N-acetyltransferase [Devosia sp.]MBO9587830.1 GNAT family N-acetyltransferase [Devosia sp.]